ncbi:hypothetical protein DENSPDRAFT_832013 [Dentipellis sp. KUC8613]|nr:hypothetical protein DENSPDRAFT_832013 [Dentipellis sp. KUC8613]
MSSTTTSFSSPALSSATPDATSTSSSGGDGGGGSSGPSPGSSSLYLYTFLATLLLLLSVSGVIIFRSMVIRRRHRQAVLEAIANGTYVPPSPPPGGRIIKLGEKPKMYEVSLTQAWYGCDDKWGSISPLSTTLSSNKLPEHEEPPRAPTPLPLPDYPLLRFSNPFRRFPAPERRADEGAKAKGNDAPADELPEDAEAQVAVLIAMPSPGRTHTHTQLPLGTPRGARREKTISISSFDTIAMEKEGARLREADLRAIGEEDGSMPVVEIGVAQVQMQARAPRVEGATDSV